MEKLELRNEKGLNEAEFLAAYKPGNYERPSVTVDTLVFTVTEKRTENYRRLPEKSLEILLIKRGDHPCIGQWAVPGGFVNMDENLEDAARRELKEETNVENIYLEQLYTWGDVGRDPRTRIITCSYLALAARDELKVQSGDDAADARWFAVSSRVVREEHESTAQGNIHKQQIRIQLSGEGLILTADIRVSRTLIGKVVKVHRELIASDGIAFDHALAVHYAIERLRSKVGYTDIAFNLLRETFTLTELQQIYEVILDQKLTKANFRRKIAGKVIETEGYSKDAGHRPSRLYRYNGEGLCSLE